jgi:hypothetical protein
LCTSGYFTELTSFHLLQACCLDAKEVLKSLRLHLRGKLSKQSTTLNHLTLDTLCLSEGFYQLLPTALLVSLCQRLLL